MSSKNERNGCCGFMSLPNELILEIVEQVEAQQPKYPALACAKYCPLRNLSLTNKRLHEIAWTLIWKRLHFNSIGNKVSMGLGAHYLQHDEQKASSSNQNARAWEVATHAKLVKSLSFGRLRYPLRTDMQFERRSPWVIAITAFFPFHNLLSFECVDGISHIAVVDTLVAAAPALRNVALVWIEPFIFPALDALQELETLRLYLVDWVIPDASAIAPLANAHMTFNTLTTLVINNSGERTDLFNLCITKLSFPKLLVLNLQGAGITAPLVFDFVQRHSTLLEVTIQSFAGCFRLEALVKLIEGTGTWINTSNALTGQPSFVELSPTSPNPPALSKLYGALLEFSFTRIPLTPDSLGWKSSIGSSKPRYACTSIALRFVDNEIIPEDETFYDMLEFLMSAPKTLRDVQELYLATEEPLDGAISFEEMATSIRDRLRRWPKVRKMIVSWPMSSIFRRCDHDQGMDVLCLKCRSASTCFLDDTCPPAFIGDGLFTTLHDVRNWRGHNSDRVEEAVRIALRVPDNAGLDDHDPHLLMSAWEAYNYPLVARLVREIAECNPTLEQFDWLVRECPFANDTIRWDWKVKRHANGSVKAVVGDLRWTGCSKGTPPPFLALVGKERDYAYHDAGGRWLPDYAWPGFDDN